MLSALLLVALTAGGCELAEVAAPESEDILTVEALLRVGQPRQRVLLHRSVEGRLIRGEPGAEVTVAGPNGLAVSFQAAQLSECLLEVTDSIYVEETAIEASCYISPQGAGFFVQPGNRYDLRIETQRGEVVRGRTDVPGNFGFRNPVVALDPEERVGFCTLSDKPFELAWGRSEGAWAYLVALRHTGWGSDLKGEGVEVPDPLDLLAVAVSAADTTLLFPENVGLFDRFDIDRRVFEELEKGLPRADTSVLSILATDRNYTNAIRGGRFNPSGNVRFSSVIGDGVGLFGSVVQVTIRSSVGSGGTRPPACQTADLPG